MSRTEAIKIIAEAFQTVKSEMCCSNEERRGTDEDMIEALKALDVQDNELPRVN